MFSDYAFQANVAALSTTTDLIKKCVYIKICGPKPGGNTTWPQWDWNNGLVYTVNFDDLHAFATEIIAIVQNTSKEPTTKRAYKDNSKIVAFGKGADGVAKLAIQNTMKDGSVQKTAFSFVNAEDLNRFVMLLNFLTQRSDQFFFAEFIINSVYNLVKSELYKVNKPQNGGSANGSGYNKQPYQNKQQQPVANLDDMLGADTPSMNNAVNNVVGDFGGSINKDVQDLL